MCARPVSGFSSADYATHLRTHPNVTYAHLTEHLGAWNIVACPTGGEARVRTSRGNVHKHNCAGAVGPASPDEPWPASQGFQRPPEWDTNLPWPSNTPFPPPGTPHPSTLISTHQLVRRVPAHVMGMWADIVTKSCDALSDAIECGSDEQVSLSLLGVLRMSQHIRKTKRGGRSSFSLFAKKLRTVLDDLEKPTKSFHSLYPVDEDNARVAPSDPDAARIKACETEARLNYLGRAARMLRSTEIFVDPTPEVSARLAQKFPAARTNIDNLDPLPAGAPHFLVEEEDFAKALRKVLTGSAGGATGLRGDHLKPLLDFPDAVCALHRMFTHIIDARLPDWAQPYIAQQMAVALGEKERPICMGELIARTASSLVDKTVPEESDRKYFLQVIKGQRVFQLGSSVKGGQEVAVHVVNALVHDTGKGVADLSNDGKNAYNSTDRVYAVNATMAEFPTTARWVRWYYGKPAIINHGTTHMWGAEGPMQGCPLGGRIHDTAFQRALIRTALLHAAEHPTEPVDLIAFRDDAHIVGAPEHALRVHKLLTTVRHELIGIGPSPEKDEAYCPRVGFPDDETHAAALDLLVASFPGDNKLGQPRARANGLALLGGAIGEDDFVSAHLNRALMKHPDFLPRLAKTSPECALPLLRKTYLPIATNLQRVTPPSLMRAPARAFDNTIRACYARVTNDPDANDGTHNTTLAQPFKHGGMGLRSVETTSPIAFFASVTQAFCTLTQVDEHVAAAIAHYSTADPDVPAPAHPSTTVGIPALLVTAWTEAHESTFSAYPNALFPTSLHNLFCLLAEKELSPTHLQRALCQLYEKSVAEEIAQHLSPIDAARTTALKTSGSSLVLSAVADHASVVLPASAITSNAQLRLGTLQLPERVCCCGKETTTVAHIFSCKRLRGRFIRHDIVVEVLFQLMRAAGFTVRKEIHIVEGSAKRMDLVVYTANRVFWIDVSILNPLAATYIGMDDPLPTREKHKVGKYGGNAKAAGAVFVPFVMSFYGGLATGAIEVLQMIAQKAHATTPNPSIDDPARWMAAYRTKATHRVVSALAFAVDLSVDEAKIRGQGKSMPNLYRKIFRRARRIAVVN